MHDGDCRRSRQASHDPGLPVSQLSNGLRLVSLAWPGAERQGCGQRGGEWQCSAVQCSAVQCSAVQCRQCRVSGRRSAPDLAVNLVCSGPRKCKCTPLHTAPHSAQSWPREVYTRTALPYQCPFSAARLTLLCGGPLYPPGHTCPPCLQPRTRPIGGPNGIPKNISVTCRLPDTPIFWAALGPHSTVPQSNITAL